MLYTVLKNGLQVALKSRQSSHVVALQCWVNVGSVHEQTHEQGIVHFIEHMLFKGTKQRAVGEIAATIEACGGEINAFTTFERTVFYLVLSSQYADLGVEILADALANSTFDEAEFEKEKQVILEEVRQGLDSPSQIIAERLLQHTFRGTQAARPIIGSFESVSKLTRDHVFDFYKKWYTPENVAFVAVGDIDPLSLQQKVESEFGRMRATSPLKRNALKVEPMTQSVAELIKGDYQVPRVEISFQTPKISDVEQIPLDLASFCLGLGEACRLQQRLRNQLGIVTAASSSLFATAFGGIFSISFTSSEENILRALKEIASLLARFGGKDPIDESELGRARANIRADKFYKSELMESQAKSLGFSLSSGQGLFADEIYEATVEEIEPELVNSTFQRIIKLDKAVIVGLVGQASPLTEGRLLDAFRQGWVTSEKSESKTRRPAQKSACVIETTVLANGIQVIHRRQKQSKIHSVCLATAGGARYESKENTGIFNAMASVFGRASQVTDFESFAQSLEGLGSSIHAFSGKDSFGFSMSCPYDRIDSVTKLYLDSICKPAVEKKLWSTAQNETLQAIKAQYDSPESVCFLKFQESVFLGHPYGRPIFGNSQTVSSFSARQIEEFYHNWQARNPWILTTSSFLELSEILELLKPLQQLPVGQQIQPAPEIPLLERDYSHNAKKDREQAHICFGFQGLGWQDSDRYALDVLTHILGGHGGRLFMRLRDRDSLAYTVSPIQTYGCCGGAIGAYIACAPPKVDTALSSLQRELMLIAENPVDNEEIQRAHRYIVGSHELEMQRSESQVMSMTLMQLYGLGYQDFLGYSEKVRSVSPKQVQRVAERLFQDKPSVSVCVGP